MWSISFLEANGWSTTSTKYQILVPIITHGAPLCRAWSKQNNKWGFICINYSSTGHCAGFLHVPKALWKSKSTALSLWTYSTYTYNTKKITLPSSKRIWTERISQKRPSNFRLWNRAVFWKYFVRLKTIIGKGLQHLQCCLKHTGGHAQMAF